MAGQDLIVYDTFTFQSIEIWFFDTCYLLSPGHVFAVSWRYWAITWKFFKCNGFFITKSDPHMDLEIIDTFWVLKGFSNHRFSDYKLSIVNPIEHAQRNGTRIEFPQYFSKFSSFQLSFLPRSSIIMRGNRKWAEKTESLGKSTLWGWNINISTACPGDILSLISQRNYIWWIV